MFIDNKLKKILFQDKNKMNLYNPDIILKLEKERDQSLTVHKKLGSYCIHKDPVFKALKFDELNGMDPVKGSSVEELNTLLTAIREGADKIGPISHVTADNMPVFTHRTFTEYFAAVYVCDVLKSDKFNLHQKTLFYYATWMCCYNNTGKWIDVIQEQDEDLRRILKKIESRELKPLCNMSYARWYLMNRMISKGQFIRLVSSSADDYFDDCLDKYIVPLSILRDNQDDDCMPFIKEMYNDISSKMKTHLKKYFVTNREDDR